MNPFAKAEYERKRQRSLADIVKYGACKACSGPKYSDYDGYCSVCHVMRQALAEMVNKNK